MTPLRLALALTLMVTSSLAFAQKSEKLADATAASTSGASTPDAEKTESRPAETIRKVRVVLPSPYDDKRP